MVMPTQEELKYFWLTSAEGNLCGREQAKAWALREVWQQEGKSPYGMLPFIAGCQNELEPTQLSTRKALLETDVNVSVKVTPVYQGNPNLGPESIRANPKTHLRSAPS